MTKERLEEILNTAWRRTDNTDAWDNIIDAMKIAVNEAIDEAANSAAPYVSHGETLLVTKNEIFKLKIPD